MKKVILALALLVGVVVISKAGIPITQPLPPQQGSYYDSSLWSSTAPAAGSLGTITFAAPSSRNSGGSSYSGQNCLTRLMVQISTSITVNVLDGATTNYQIIGLALGSSGQNTFNLLENGLEPLCATYGNSMTIDMSLSSGSGVTNANFVNVINAEGYIRYAPNINAGK